MVFDSSLEKPLLPSCACSHLIEAETPTLCIFRPEGVISGFGKLKWRNLDVTDRCGPDEVGDAKIAPAHKPIHGLQRQP